MLLDINMPDLNGFEVLKEISKFNYLKNIPIIMLTARSLKEDILTAIKLGAKDYLKKPVDIDKILEKIAKFLPADKTPAELDARVEGEMPVEEDISAEKIDDLLDQILQN